MFAVRNYLSAPHKDWTDAERLGRIVSFYQLYELNHAAMAPWRALADATRLTFQNPLHPLFDTPLGRSVAAAAELFERTTRRYGKPEFGITSTEVDRK